MRNNKRPTSIASVIFYWVLATLAIVLDAMVLLPGGNLAWWQIVITVSLVAIAIHTTIVYRKEQKVETNTNKE